MPLYRSTPEEQGISSLALLAFLQDIEQKIDALHSLMLIRHGQVIAEGWWAPYAADEPHAVYSISKSFTSIAVGLATAEARLNIDDPVLRFFPDEAPPNPSKNLSTMRVRDLLRLTTGHRGEDLKSFPYLSNEDLVKVFLELPVPDEPGTLFIYDEPAVYMLSVIIQKTTGQTLLDYLHPRLFEPLGISNPTWWATASGIPLGASGLSIRTEEIASFGQLCLQKGQWYGRQIIPAAWIDAATSLQISTGNDSSNSEWALQDYGYLFWLFKHGFCAAGLLGQMCIVMPEFDAVLAVTAGAESGPSVLELVRDRIVPAFRGSVLAADHDSNRKFLEKLASLTLKTQVGEATSPIAAKIVGKRYVFPENQQQIESIEFEAKPDGANVTIALRIAGKEQRIVCRKGEWVKGMLEGDSGRLIPMTGYLGGDSDKPIPIAASGAWSSHDTYAVILCRYQTAFISTYYMRFSGDELVLEHSAPLLQNQVRLTGKMRASNSV